MDNLLKLIAVVLIVSLVAGAVDARITLYGSVEDGRVDDNQKRITLSSDSSSGDVKVSVLAQPWAREISTRNIFDQTSNSEGQESDTTSDSTQGATSTGNILTTTWSGIISSTGTSSYALSTRMLMWRLYEDSTELHIDAKSVSGTTTVGSEFTISVTATDSDDVVTRVSLGKPPFTSQDYDIRDCSPLAYTCTETFQLTETSAGTYTYRIKAKNTKGQITNDAITVTVVDSSEADWFNFRTASIDGAMFSSGTLEYMDSQIYLNGNGVVPLLLTGIPFATFSVPSNKLLSAKYDAPNYIVDTDYFFFDSRLPSCTGSGCTLTSVADEGVFTTECELVISDNHYSCTLTDGEGYEVSFDYRATTDPIGYNTIRRYNLLYPESVPIVDFGIQQFSFAEGGSYVIDLDEYVYDEDNDPSEISWSVELDEHLAISINPSTNEATITQGYNYWIGNEILRFVATDPAGNKGSAVVTVRVTQVSNDPPVISVRSPDSPIADVGLSGSGLFHIEAYDPDFDPISITWMKGNTIVATDTFDYRYVDTTGVPQRVRVTVSDGQEQVETYWDVDFVAPIGTIAGTVQETNTGARISGVLVEALSGITVVDSTVTDGSGSYSLDILEGTYNLRFSKTGYFIFQVAGVDVVTSSTTTVDVDLDPTPVVIGTVQGTATEGGVPLQGVVVDVMSGMTLINSTTTNSVGTYSMDIIGNVYDIRFSKIGYFTFQAASVNVAPDSTTTVDADLVPNPVVIGTVQGTVTEGGVPLQGVVVDVMSGMTLINSTTTNSVGTYSMDVIGNVYDIRFSKSGYKTLTTQSVAIPAGTSTTVDSGLYLWWNPITEHSTELVAVTNTDMTGTFMFWRIDNTPVWQYIDSSLGGLYVVKDNTSEVPFQLFDARTPTDPFYTVFGDGLWIGLNADVVGGFTGLTLYVDEDAVEKKDVVWFQEGHGASGSTDTNILCPQFNANVQINTSRSIWGEASLSHDGTVNDGACRRDISGYNDVTILSLNYVDAFNNGGDANNLGLWNVLDGPPAAVIGSFPSDARWVSSRKVGATCTSCCDWQNAYGPTASSGWHTFAIQYDGAQMGTYVDAQSVQAPLSMAPTGCGVQRVNVQIRRANSGNWNFMLISKDTLGTALDVSGFKFGTGTGLSISTNLGTLR